MRLFSKIAPAARHLAVLGAAALALAGCGGGSGSSMPSTGTPPPPTGTTSPPDPPMPPDPPGPPAPRCTSVADGRCLADAEFVRARDALAARKVDAGEYALQPAFRLINLPQAHAALELRDGTTLPDVDIQVAMLDGDLHLDSRRPPLLRGVDLSVTHLQTSPGEEPRDTNHAGEVTTMIGGIRVAGTGAAQPASPGAQYTGVAPLPGLDIDIYSTPHTVQHAEAIRDVLSGSDPHFVNVSLGEHGMFIENWDEARVRREYGDVIAAVAQASDLDPAVFVFAAGNEHGAPCELGADENCVVDNSGRGQFNASSPDTITALMVRAAELRDRMAAAVAVDANGVITSFSNRCGAAAQWCIAAPGMDLAVGLSDTGVISTGSGTSYSAPIVVGGLALMRQYFREQMTGTDLLRRLYATANKTGRYADADLSGRG